MCGEGDHDHDNGDNHDYCWSYVWEGGLLCEENKFWHLHYHLHVSGEILQVKFWQNILWILIIIAAQESETRPLDFTETMQRPALTSVSVNLNRGGSKGFDNREGAEGALTYVLWRDCHQRWILCFCNLWLCAESETGVSAKELISILLINLWMNECQQGIKWMH